MDLLDKSISYYDILGVSKEATSSEIKRAYRKLAIQYHPDKQIGKSEDDIEKAEKIMARINKIFSILMDEDNRAYYDENGEEDKTSRKYTTKENSPIFDEIFKIVKMPAIETPYTALEHIALKPAEVINGVSKLVKVNDYENNEVIEIMLKIPSGVRDGMILTYHDVVQFESRSIKSSVSIALTVKKTKKLVLQNNTIMVRDKKENIDGAKSIVIAGSKIELDDNYEELGKNEIYRVFKNKGLIDIVTKKRGNLILKES